MADLVTPDEVTAALANLTSAQTSELSAVITGASRAIERYCDRVLASADLVDYHEPGLTRTIRLREYPVTAVGRVASQPTAILKIQCADSTASRASVSMEVTGDSPYLTPTGITLYKTASGARSNHTFDFATYATASALQAAILSYGGWSCDVETSVANWATVDLTPDVGARDAKETAASIWGFTREINDYSLNTRTGVITMGGGWPYGIPLGATAWWTPTFRYPDRLWGVDKRFGQVMVSYTAGYTAIPDDLKRACVTLIQGMFDNETFSGLVQSEQSGTDKYVLNPRASDLIAGLGLEGYLRPYRRREAV